MAPIANSNPFIRALDWGGWFWTQPDGFIDYVFFGAGQNLYDRGSPYVDGQDTPGAFVPLTHGWDVDANFFRLAINEWAKVANINPREVFTYQDADLVEWTWNQTNYPGFLGIHETPQDAANKDGKAWGAFNDAATDWTLDGMQRGGLGFETLLHEIGHALGLAHPHDTSGGESGLFPGVNNGDAFGNFGQNGLNQGIFTIMSYNQGWQAVIGKPSGTFGQPSTPMAFDIAAIQNKYGARAANTGSDTYVLGVGNPDIVCIWDTGGADEIRYDGVFGCVIDLRAATLLNQPGGGGFVSYIYGAPDNFFDHWDAFTIANGVIIENATGGSGSDILVGNNASNTLTGRAGNDVLTGGRGQDFLSGGADRDIFDFNNTAEAGKGANRDKILNFQRGTDDIDLKGIDAKKFVSGNQAFKFIGRQDFHDKKGEVRYEDKGSKVIVQGDVNGDGRPDFEIFVPASSLAKGDFLL